MTVFSDAVDAMFESDVAQNAVWTASDLTETTIRIRSRREDDIAGFGPTRIKSDNRMVFDVRKSEMPSPAKGDEIWLDDVGYIIKSHTSRDPDRLIWSVECEPA